MSSSSSSSSSWGFDDDSNSNNSNANVNSEPRRKRQKRNLAALDDDDGTKKTTWRSNRFNDEHLKFADHLELVPGPRARAELAKLATAPHHDIIAHGSMRFDDLTTFRVPPRTAIAFFTIPGEVAYFPGTQKNFDRYRPAILRGDLAARDLEGRYVTLYVAGDVINDMIIHVSDIGDFPTPRDDDGHARRRHHRAGRRFISVLENRRGAKYAKDDGVTLSKIIDTLGPGMYIVGACRNNYDLGIAPITNMRRPIMTQARFVDLLARTRFKTDPRADVELAELAAPNLPIGHSKAGFGGLHLSDMKAHPFIGIDAHMKRKNPNHGVLGVGVGKPIYARDYRHGRWHTSYDHPISKNIGRYIGTRFLSNPTSDPETTSRLRQKFGFDTPDDKQARRLLLYHKSRTIGENAHAELDRAFHLRASVPTNAERQRASQARYMTAAAATLSAELGDGWKEATVRGEKPPDGPYDYSHTYIPNSPNSPRDPRDR